MSVSCNVASFSKAWGDSSCRGARPTLYCGFFSESRRVNQGALVMQDRPPARCLENSLAGETAFQLPYSNIRHLLPIIGLTNHGESMGHSAAMKQSQPVQESSTNGFHDYPLRLLPPVHWATAKCAANPCRMSQVTAIHLAKLPATATLLNHVRFVRLLPGVLLYLRLGHCLTPKFTVIVSVRHQKKNPVLRRDAPRKANGAVPLLAPMESRRSTGPPWLVCFAVRNLSMVVVCLL